MILKWNKSCLKVIELIATADFSPERSHITLLPGINEVTDAEYGAMKPHIKFDIELKTLEVVEVKTLTAPGKPQKMASSLNEMPIKVAVKMIGECESGETLNVWLAKDSRPEIRSRIRDRLKKLELVEVEMDIDLLDENEKAELAATSKGKEEK